MSSFVLGRPLQWDVPSSPRVQRRTRVRLSCRLCGLELFRSPRLHELLELIESPLFSTRAEGQALLDKLRRGTWPCGVVSGLEFAGCCGQQILRSELLIC